MEQNKINLLSALECAEICLSDDITALGYFQDEYFGTIKPDVNFTYKYKEMMNYLQTLYKSMLFNHDAIKNAIDEGFAIAKAGVKDE